MASRRQGARIDPADHADPSWHINQVAADFDLIDAWQLPVTGEPDEFSEFVRFFRSQDLGHDENSTLYGLLFTVREKLGDVLGWDEEVLTQPIPGCQETSLRDRLSDELRATIDPSEDKAEEFRMVYETDAEAAMELSNSTVHAAIHFAWIRSTDGLTCFGQMGIFVKHRGRLGRIYMPAIAPFRHYIVYPALMRRLEAGWRTR